MHIKLLSRNPERLIKLVKACHKAKRVREHIAQAMLFRWHGSEDDRAILKREFGEMRPIKQYGTKEEIYAAFRAIGFSAKVANNAANSAIYRNTFNHQASIRWFDFMFRNKKERERRRMLDVGQEYAVRLDRHQARLCN